MQISYSGKEEQMGIPIKQKMDSIDTSVPGGEESVANEAPVDPRWEGLSKLRSDLTGSEEN